MSNERNTAYGKTPDALGLSEEQLVALGASRISPIRVATRKDRGKTLSYVEAWDVKATLIKVFGFGGFSVDLVQSTLLDWREVPNKDKTGTNWQVIAQATVRLTIHATGATYTETATGNNAQPNLPQAMDTALKSAESDALKRAAVFLGTQFGLSLYAKTTDDVCRPILEPTQKAMWEATIEKRKDEATQAALDRATGRENVAGAEDADAEAASYNAAGEESQDTGQGGEAGEQS